MPSWVTGGAEIGSMVTGTESIETASEPDDGGGDDCDCLPGGPSNLPTFRKTYTITKLTGVQYGGANQVYKNQGGILIQVLNTILASPYWEVIASSNGTTMTVGENVWLTYADLNFGAWITFRNTVSGREYLILVSVAFAWLEITTYGSVAGFTGGSGPVAPTAVDQETITPPTGADWLGTDASVGAFPDPLFRAWVWQSTDGEITRVVWIFDPETGALTVTNQAMWFFDTINCPVGGTWNPTVNWMYDNPGGYAIPTQYMSLTRFLFSPKKIRSNGGINEDCLITADQFGSNYLVDTYPTNETSLQKLWQDPPTIVAGNLAAGRNGAVGWFYDVFFIGSIGGNTPQFPAWDTGGNRTVLFIDAMMLPWDGSVPPGQPGSTDHPAAGFFGRNAI